MSLSFLITASQLCIRKMAAKTNKFCALRENELERDVDDANGTSFENEVHEAVKVALSSLLPDTKPNKKNTKGKTTTTTTHEGR